MARTVVLAFASMLVAALTRVLNEDLPAAWSLPKKWRAAIAGGLGVISGVIDLVANGAHWGQAFTTILATSGSGLIMLLVEALAGGTNGTNGTKIEPDPIPVAVSKSKPPPAQPYSPTKMAAYPLMLATAFAVTVAMLFCSGCASSLETAKVSRPKTVLEAGVTLSDYCIGLDSGSRMWGAIAKISGALSGASGISTLPIPDTDKTARALLIGTSTFLAAAAVTALFVEDSDTSAWARDCAAAPAIGAK